MAPPRLKAAYPTTWDPIDFSADSADAKAAASAALGHDLLSRAAELGLLGYRLLDSLALTESLVSPDRALLWGRFMIGRGSTTAQWDAVRSLRYDLDGQGQRWWASGVAWVASRMLTFGVPRDTVDTIVAPAWTVVHASAQTLRDARWHGPYSPSTPAALLGCRFPVQQSAERGEMIALAENALPEIPNFARLTVRRPLHDGFAGPATLIARGENNSAWPLKAHPGATNKVNVYASEVLEALKKEDPNLLREIDILFPYMEELTDDQVSGVFIHAAGLREQTPLGLPIALAAVRSPSGAKSLSNAIKALGCHWTPLGSSLVEMNCLLGRGVGALDLRKEAEARVGDRPRGGLAIFPEDQLAEAIKAVIDEELPPSALVTFPDLDDWWTRRYTWCAPGSHSRSGDAFHGHPRITVEFGSGRVFRRIASEWRAEEPVSRWDGRVVVTASPKLEPGKTRLILACDTDSYFAFEHFLRPIEREWVGSRVIIDPGQGGHAGMCHRVESLRRLGDANVMLDYDDFNSQHSLRAQAMVIQALASRTGYPPPLAEKLMQSFYKMHVFAHGREVGVVGGTLMSGHRGTTMLNSVLNAAYIRCAVGDRLYMGVRSLHVGDDVYVSTPDAETAGAILEAMDRSPCRLNASKQGFGRECTEFLRIAGRGAVYQGYGARSAAAVISGNWVSDAKLDPIGGLDTMVRQARNLMNRYHSKWVGRLLAPSVARICHLKLEWARGLTDGSICPEGGAYYGPGPSATVLCSEWDDVAHAEAAGFNYRHVKQEATTAYLRHHVSLVEATAQVMTHVNVRRCMVFSSYARALAASAELGRANWWLETRPLASAGEPVAQALARPASYGLLTRYPLMGLMRNRLTASNTRTLVHIAGGNGTGTPADVSREAWGRPRRVVGVSGVIPYSDAAAAAGRAHLDWLYPQIYIYA